MIKFLKTRRSIRKYENRDIEQEKVDKILKAGLLSPSSKGRRPWEFIVVKDKVMLESLAKVRLVGGGPFIVNANVAIVVVANKDITGGDEIWVEDTSITATIMQLEAHDLGLGSCWVQVRGRMHDDKVTAEEYLKNTLNIPQNYGVCCILAVGYPGEKRPAYNDGDIDFSKVHYEKY